MTRYNLKYIVDIGNPLSGRTIEVEADDPKQCLFLARDGLNENKLEQVIQIRDNECRFWYTNEDGFLNPKR